MARSEENVSAVFCKKIEIDDFKIVDIGELDKLCAKVDDLDLHNSLYDQELYNICNEVENSYTERPTKRRLNFKDLSYMHGNSIVKKMRYDEEEPIPNEIECKTCDIYVSNLYLERHLNSDMHKNNISKLHNNFDNVFINDFTYDNRIITYKIKSKEDTGTIFKEPATYVNSVKEEILYLIQESILKYTAVIINFRLNANFMHNNYFVKLFTFETCNYTMTEGHDINNLISILGQILSNKVSKFQKTDFIWTIKEIRSIELVIKKFDPNASTYVRLPDTIKRKKAVVNVKNRDNFSLKWALLSALFPLEQDSERVHSYYMHERYLKFDGIRFPVELTDIPKVEYLNNISINVFGLEYDRAEDDHLIVGPLYVTNSRKTIHVNLLHVSKYYCYIKNLSKLVSRQITRARVSFICDGCLLYYSTQNELGEHQLSECFYVNTNLPNSGKKLKIGSASEYGINK